MCSVRRGIVFGGGVHVAYTRFLIFVDISTKIDCTAVEWHSRDLRFDPAYLHQKTPDFFGNWVFICILVCFLPKIIVLTKMITGIQRRIIQAVTVGRFKSAGGLTSRQKIPAMSLVFSFK